MLILYDRLTLSNIRLIKFNYLTLTFIEPKTPLVLKAVL